MVTGITCKILLLVDNRCFRHINQKNRILTLSRGSGISSLPEATSLDKSGAQIFYLSRGQYKVVLQVNIISKKLQVITERLATDRTLNLGCTWLLWYCSFVSGSFAA